MRHDSWPPVPGDAVIRPRLDELLARRFDVAVTLVLGGGGIGKTTALAQALRDDEQSLDVWCSATAQDDQERLQNKLLRAIGRPDAPTLAEAVLSEAPRAVCLIIDDLHHVRDARMVEPILDHLPGNGHVLLSSRHRPELSTSRLDVAGQLHEIGQHDLLLTDAELRDVARRRGVDIDALDGTGGWPALVEFAVRGGATGSRRYLEEEFLATLTPERRHAVARFSAVGGGDSTIAETVAGVSLDELVAGLPMMLSDRSGIVHPHDLWNEMLRDELTDAERAACGVAAAKLHHDAGNVDRAIELTAAAHAGEPFADHVAAGLIEFLDGERSVADVTRWLVSIPADAADEPVVAFARGLVLRELDPTDTACEERFDTAIHGFATSDAALLEIATIGQLLYFLFINDRFDRLGPLFARLAELSAAGERTADAYLRLAIAGQCLFGGDPAGQLDAADGIGDDALPAGWRRVRDFFITSGLVKLGRADEAHERLNPEVAERGAALPGSRVINDQARWFAGFPDVVVEQITDRFVEDAGARDRYTVAIWAATAVSFAGQSERAERYLAIARQASGDTPSTSIQQQLRAAAASPLIARGLVREAADTFRQIFDDVEARSGYEQNLRAYCAAPYCLHTESRAFWDDVDFGPTAAVPRSLARVLVAHREHDDLGAARTLEWPAPGSAAAALPVAWLVELGLIGVAAGAPAARSLVSWASEHWGAPAHVALRRFAAGDPIVPTPQGLRPPAAELMSAATEMLAVTPLPPTADVRVSVLGPMVVQHGGHTSVHPDWRRERVRTLLLFLVLRRSQVSREHVAEALWPELTAGRADKNLRTTLSYLHSVLEPMREGGDAPWFVRSDNAMLRLHPDTSVDLWDFDAHLDDAADLERAGRPRRALERYRSAIDGWRGHVGAGDADHAWADLERTRVSSRFSRAAIRAAELLIATGQPEEAIAYAHRSLDADPWNLAAFDALERAYLELGDQSAARRTRRRAHAVAAELEGDIDV